MLAAHKTQPAENANWRNELELLDWKATSASNRIPANKEREASCVRGCTPSVEALATVPAAAEDGVRFKVALPAFALLIVTVEEGVNPQL